MTATMTAPGVGTRIAHDPGDPLVTSHCPFCGSGQVVGRSDGTIGCDFCGQNYIVRVQPAFPGMPQMPTGPGAPSDVGPDGGLIDPGMVGPDGMPADGGGPPPDAGPDGGPPGASPDDGGSPPPPGADSDDDDDSGDAPPPKGKPKKKAGLHGIAVRRYSGVAGQLLTEEQLIRHIAVQASGADPRVMAALRAEGARGRVTAGKYHLMLPTGHRVSVDRHGPDWYGTISHPASSQVHYMHLGQDGDPRPAAERQLSRGPASAFIRATTPGGGEQEEAAPSQWRNTPLHASRRPFGATAAGARSARDHYRRGWAASERAGMSDDPDYSPLTKADWNGEPDAWYGGYHDFGSDRPKYHSLDCPGTGDHDGRNGCTLE